MPDIIAGKYEVLETIGRGGMGTVYKARQINLDRIVAIKMLSEELASDPEFRARFQQEATVVARLNHPNIVQVHDIEPHKNTFCIIMEFVEGENLQHKIDRDVTLPEVEVMGLGAQVASALNYAHTRGIIHRDIKPDNIHVTPKGIAKVMDFGIARFLDSKLKTQTGISMGTPKFMSPEQVTGKNVDGQTDLYSLGVCLYYCLSGRPPFDGENAISVATRHLYEQPEPPSKLNPSISPAVEAAVLKALEKQKKDRYKTGTEMAAALLEAVGAKTPIRTGAEADEQFGGATMKMPSQNYTPVSVQSPSGGLEIGDSGPRSSADFISTTPSDIASAASQATHSNTSSHSMPQLEETFRTPNSLSDSGRSEENFQKALFVFGGLVVLAVALLIALVIWLRSSDTPIAGLGFETENGSRSERIDAVDNKAEQYIKAGNTAAARQVWLDFRKAHPEVQPQRVTSEIRAVESLMPVSPSAIAERRYQEAFNALNNQERALAFAYLKAAIKLSPDLAKSAVTTSTLQNLERKLSPEPGAVAEQSARQALAAGKARLNSCELGPATQKLLIQAVETNYRDPENWETLGDFFVKSQNADSARVMYGEAASLQSNMVEAGRLQKKLAQISG